MKRGSSFTVFLLAGILAFSQAAESHIIISVIKGPSGIGGAWMMNTPPKMPGIHVEFMLSGSADLVTAKLISGEIDAGVLPINVAAKLYNAGITLQIAAVVGNGMVKFLTNDPSIHSFADLADKEVHIAGQKATPDYLFRYLASRAGLVAGKDFKSTYNLAYPEMAAQLASMRISSAVIPEPFATQARLFNPNLLEPIDLSGAWKKTTGLDSYPMSVFVISDRLSRLHPDFLLLLKEAYKNSLEKTNLYPAETGILAEKLDLGMKASVAQASIPLSAYVYIPAEQSVPSVMSILEIFLAFDSASIGGRLPDKGFFGLE